MQLRPITLTLAVIGAICMAARTTDGQVTVTASGGEVISFSQKNVVDHMTRADSVEVEMAKLAQSRSQNSAVRDFADMLVKDHQSHLDNLHKLAGKRDIGREANAADTSAIAAIRTLSDLRAMPADSGFDRAFIREQIRDHVRDINMLKMLRPAAKDDDLQQDIDRTMPVLERHLARAREIAAQLGVPADTSRTTSPRRRQ
jgi:putative membrane protein